MRSFLVLVALFATVLSCKKGDDFIDSTSQFPLGWKSSDSFPIVAYSMRDSIGPIVNMGACPLGTVISSNFGTVKSGFFASFQTTLSSTSFSFSQVDSISLLIPYYRALPTYGNSTNSSFNIQVFEVLEALETLNSSRKMNYSLMSTPVGSIANYKISLDSILDINGKLTPSIRIPLSLAFANKLIAKSYADDAEFQQVLKGLYIGCDNQNTNGYIMVGLSTELRIKIYGKNSSGTQVSSEFISGGTRSTTINAYSHDASSMAQNAAQNANKVSGDPKVFTHGIYGYYGRLVLPDVSAFSKNKEIFKAELTLYGLDTGLLATSDLGILFLDSNRQNQESQLLDDFYRQNFRNSVRDTIINGRAVKKYIYNIGMHLAGLNSKSLKGNQFNIYPTGVVNTGNALSKLTNVIPASFVFEGSMQPLSPKLTLYYIEK